MDFDIYSKEVRTKAIKSVSFWILISVLFYYIPMTRLQVIGFFSLVIIGLNIYQHYPLIDGVCAKNTIKALIYLYLFVGVISIVGAKLLIYGAFGYFLFILLYVAFILYRRWDLYISGIDQIVGSLRKMRGKDENGNDRKDKPKD